MTLQIKFLFSGNFHPFIAPFGIFPSKDGYIALAVVENHFWIELATRLGKTEFINQDMSKTVESRRANLNLVNDTVSIWTSKYTN